MVTMQKILDQLTGKDIVDALLHVMEENFDDFAEAQTRYYDAMHTLQKELGEDSVPSVKDAMEAIQRQTASDLFFSGFLGIKANLKHFIDPISRNFLDVDPEIYLRESTAHRLPEYARAQAVLDRFFALLSPAQRELYTDVLTYVSHLETVGPKLAHYCGYILGNEILYRVIPGYHLDLVQTTQYTAMLENYFGIQLG